MKTFLFPALTLLLSLTAARADKYVYTDVQFLVFVPTNTALAAYTPATLTQANTAADALITASNTVFDRGQRGLRYRRFGDVQFVTAAEVGDSGDADTINDIDNLFCRPGESASACYTRAFLLPYTLAPARPTQWKYRSDMCNFYLLPITGGGIGSIGGQDATNENIVIQGHFGIDPGVHELGHWFAIPHTFLSTQTDTPLAPGALIQWGEDGFDDTLLDWHQGGHTLNSLSQDDYTQDYSALNATQKGAIDTKFRNHYAKQFYNTTYAALTAGQKTIIDGYRTRDQNFNDSFSTRDAALLRDLIANGNFGSPGSPVFYSGLFASNKARVDNLIMNVESYHFGKGSTEGYFSEKQLDRMCDAISVGLTESGNTRDRTAARALESGRYIFFGGPVAVPTVPADTSLNPRANIVSAQNAVTIYPPPVPPAEHKNDIIIGRPGVYDVPGPDGTTLRLNKRCTYRATKDGAFSIRGH